MSTDQPVEIQTIDGTILQGMLYVPQGHFRRAVLVSGGLGIQQRFYASFAPGWRSAGIWY